MTIRRHDCRQLNSIPANGIYHGRHRYDSVTVKLDGYEVDVIERDPEDGKVQVSSFDGIRGF